MGQSPVGTSVTNDKSGVEFHQGKGCFTEKELSKSEAFTSAPTKLIDFEAIIMSVRAPVGDVNLVNRTICIGRGLCAIKPLIDIQYTFTYLSTLKKWLESKATGSTFKAINGDLIQSILVPIPPKNEQLRIISKLFEMETKIKDYLECNKQLDKINSEVVVNLRNAVLQYAIQGKLVPQDPNDKPVQIQCKNPIIRRDNSYYEIIKGEETCIDDEIPFEVPSSWNWVRMKDIGKWGSGSTPNRSNPNYYKGSIPWIKTGELNEKYIFSTEEHVTELALNECHLPMYDPGTVIIAMYAGSTIGKTSILKISATTNQACCCCKPPSDIMPEYLALYLQSQKSHLQSLGFGSAQSNISKQKIESTLFAVPPLNEQKRILEKIELLQSSLCSLDDLQ